jgi:SAM-dependent methyltransferase
VTATLPVDPGNTEQLRAWDGNEGAYWAGHADHFERSLAAYRQPFFGAAAIASGDRVLDIGCGTGDTTRQAARLATTGSALGVDLSSAMLAIARRRAAADGITNAQFVQADAQVHPFDPGGFDVAIGRTSAMFFGDRVAGLANIARALRANGRLALLTWQPVPANEWFREFSTAMAAGRDLPTPPPEAPSPFSLSDPDVIRSVLDAAGYTDISIDGRREPMWFGADAQDAFGLVSGLLGWMVDGLDDAARAGALDALRETISRHETTDGVLYDSAVWIVRATRL